MKPIIKVQNLSKHYRIGESGTLYATLRESLMGMVRAARERLQRNGQEPQGMFQALKHIDLEIMPGEVVGIVGANGAGKSTLLKILSRVTEPTTGRIDIYGRIGSLLEVGTGFHPELTGRENVFLNGAILGMKKQEIKERFDEIVRFAEIEKFLDMPVKRYSSGMYVRLAFAVAVHLDPDILLVDEVLSVGDMAFQRKCLDKIGSLRSKAKTILIVSHNMIAVRAVCERVILLSQGKVVADGRPDEIVPLYEKLMLEDVRTGNVPDEVEEGMGQVQIGAVRLLDAEGQEKKVFETSERIKVVIDYNAVERVDDAIVYAGIRRPDGFVCTGTSTKLEGLKIPRLEGTGQMEVEIPELLVLPGYYMMDVIFYDQNFEHRNYFLGRKRVSFKVQSSLSSLDEKYGVVYQKQNWTIRSDGAQG